LSPPSTALPAEDFPLSDLFPWLRHGRIATRNQFNPGFTAKNAFAATLMLIAGSLVATGEEPRVILEEDFERYTNTAVMRAVWPQGAGVLELRAPAGGQAVIHDGGAANRRGGFSVAPSQTHNVVLTADLFDYGTNANQHMTVSLVNRSGGHVEMGVVNSGEIYAARTVGLRGSTDAWTPLNPAQEAVRGWHRFQTVISLSNTVTTLDLDANGKVDWTVTLAGPPPAGEWTEVRFGGLPDHVSPSEPVLVDNIRLELVPAPPVQLAQSAAAATEPGIPVANARTTFDSGAVPATTITAVWWIMFALALIIALLVWLVLALRRSGLRASTALQPAGGNSPPFTHEAAIAELTAFAKQSLVQGLYEQRNALIETQKQAQQALIELEQRLAALHLPQQERIHAYERRITELEKELETRGEEVRELTQATLLLVRRKLEEEKGLGQRRDQFN
jgi:hypothetical protein